jgi:hypothetical protein
MPDLVKCLWEWNGANWTRLSGPSNCSPPLPPRDPPGTQLYTQCADVVPISPSPPGSSGGPGAPTGPSSPSGPTSPSP